jgi:26S proteasome regulatory subunit N1
MTSVPKPLKFLAPHYAALKALYESWSSAATGGANAPAPRLLADLLSVLAMTMGTAPCESLRYKLRGNPADLDSWGHEYVRALSGEIAADWVAREEAAAAGVQPQPGAAAVETDVEPLRALVALIVPFQMRHNAEVEVGQQQQGGG